MDLYVILGLTHGATESDIKRAYRRLARRFHPDINPGDRTAEARFKQILDAYETLIDPARRSRYEAGQAEPTPPRTSGFEGFDFSRRGTGDHAATFGDLFAEVLNERRAAPSSQARGSDLHYGVELTFAESFSGTSRVVHVTRHETCRTCAGARVTNTNAVPCLVCQGSGVVQSVRGHMVFSRRCVSCGGLGQQRPRPCAACGGTGQETRAERVRVRIGAGVADGDRLRVEGKGNAGVGGGPTGDLYLSVRVIPDPRFRRDGANLHLSLPVAVHEAALGARIEVPAPDGPVRVTIPPGTQSGRQLRVRERGMPSGRDGQRGDLIVDVRLMLPEVLDERSRELLREFGRINGESVRNRTDVPVKASQETITSRAPEGAAADRNAAMAGRRDGEAR